MLQLPACMPKGKCWLGRGGASGVQTTTGAQCTCGAGNVHVADVNARLPASAGSLVTGVHE